MLSEEKQQKKLINAYVITGHNAIVISCDEQMRLYIYADIQFQLIQTLSNKSK